jgi:hypothetical protein
MLLVGFTVPAANGIVAMSTVWLIVPPLLLLWLAHYLHRHWNVGARDLIRASTPPLVAVVLLVAAVAAGRHLIGTGKPALQLAMVLTLSVLACMGLLLHDRRGLTGRWMQPVITRRLRE